ncbi:MAG: MFS transporter [Streptosporangiaceae bacterium]
MTDAMKTPDGTGTPGSAGRGTGALAAICVAYFVVILDTTVVNVALPALGRGLHTTTTGLEWVVDAYSLAFAALLLSAGALADRRGARAVFQAGVGLFACASLACGLAPSTGVLVAARAVQGIGAALAVPASLALLQAAFDDQAARRRAFGIWGGVAGIAAGTGPVLGGALVGWLGWRAVFFVNLPIAALGLALGARHLPAPAPRPHGADPAGQAAGVIALFALTAALIEAGGKGWTSEVVLGGLGIFALAGAAFVAIEHSSTAAMLPLGLFTSTSFTAASTVGLLINLGFYGELFVLSLYLQQVHRMSPLLAGVALLPQMAMAVVGSTVSGRVMAQRGPRTPMLAGLTLGAAGLGALGAAAGPHQPYWPLAAAMVAVGFGMSFTMPAATAAVMEAAPAARGGLASGTLNAARQAGGVVGVALLGTLVARQGGFAGGLRAAMAMAAGAFALGALLTAIGVPVPATNRRPDRAGGRR